MTPKVSRIVLVFEALLIALPITALAVFGATLVFATSPPDSAELRWLDTVEKIHVGVSLVAIAAGWYLIVVGILGGAEALRRTHLLWWIAAGIGVVLIAVAYASALWPPAPEYTPQATFREYIGSPVLATPLLLVLGHLWAEWRFRKS